MITILNMGELQPGTRAEIVGFNPANPENEAFLHRLYEVGFLAGTPFEVIGEAPYSHDPISIRIKEATYALRRNEANLIQVRICE